MLKFDWVSRRFLLFFTHLFTNLLNYLQYFFIFQYSNRLALNFKSNRKRSFAAVLSQDFFCFGRPVSLSIVFVFSGSLLVFHPFILIFSKHMFALSKSVSWKILVVRAGCKIAEDCRFQQLCSHLLLHPNSYFYYFCRMLFFIAIFVDCLYDIIICVSLRVLSADFPSKKFIVVSIIFQYSMMIIPNKIQQHSNILIF